MLVERRVRTHGGAACACGCCTHNINGNTVTWNSLDREFVNPNSHKIYLEHPGPSRAISSVEKPMNIFMHLLTDNALQIIFHETNRYHQQNAPNDNYWKDVTPTEMIAFFGVNIVMGMVRLPEISDYWKRIGVMEVSWFRPIFTRKQFYGILKYLHLPDNTKTPEKTDPNYKLHKLGGIIELLNASFTSGYTPCQQITIDEQMTGIKSRISFLQCMPKKSKIFGWNFEHCVKQPEGIVFVFNCTKESPILVKNMGLPIV